MTALQPILWLILYSAIASSTMQHSGIENYTAFMLPGLIVLISFSTCSSSGIMNYLMKSDGSFDRILIAPLTRSSIVLAQLLEAVLCTFLEVGIMIALSLLFSVRFSLPLSGYLIFISLIFLTSFFSQQCTVSHDRYYRFLTYCNQSQPFTHMIQALRSLDSIWQNRHRESDSCFVAVYPMGSLSFLWACRQLEKDKFVAEDSVITYVCMFRISMSSGIM